MGKKIEDYTNNVSVTPDDLSLLDLSEKIGVGSYESRKWTLTAFKSWVNSWVVAGAIAWADITGKPTTLSGYGITDAVDGSGTANKLPKWSDSNTLTDSQVQDDGSTIGIGTTPSSTAMVRVVDSSRAYTFYAQNQKTTGAPVGVLAVSNGAGSSNVGVQGQASNGSSVNYGVNGQATGNGASALNWGVLGEANQGLNNHGVRGVATGAVGENIGVSSQAQSGSTNYCFQGQDGTEGIGKFLKVVASNGKANWSTISTTDISDISDYALIASPSFTGQISVDVVTNGSPIANAWTYDCDNGMTQLLDLNGATADTTLSISNPREGNTYTLVVIQGSGAYDLTFPTGWWINDSAFDFTTLSNDERALVTLTYLSSTWYFSAKKLTNV